jgi:hypothetical protein
MSHSVIAVWNGCGDNRLVEGRMLFAQESGLAPFDDASFPGGCLALVSSQIDPHAACDRLVGIYEVLHDPKNIVLEAHFDCGAVKKILGKTFASEAEEREFLLKHLLESKDRASGRYPGRNIIGILSWPENREAGVKAKFERVF